MTGPTSDRLRVPLPVATASGVGHQVTVKSLDCEVMMVRGTNTGWSKLLQHWPQQPDVCIHAGSMPGRGLLPRTVTHGYESQLLTHNKNSCQLAAPSWHSLSQAFMQLAST